MNSSPDRRSPLDGQPSGPRHVSGIIAHLMARRGYNQLQLSQERAALWQRLVGSRLGSETRPGTVKNGVWEVVAKNSVVMQELAFRKTELVRQLREVAPEEKIKDLRFRVGVIDDGP